MDTEKFEDLGTESQVRVQEGKQACISSVVLGMENMEEVVLLVRKFEELLLERSLPQQQRALAG